MEFDTVHVRQKESQNSRYQCDSQNYSDEHLFLRQDYSALSDHNHQINCGIYQWFPGCKDDS